MNALASADAQSVDFEQVAHDKVMEWSALCRRFLDFQRREILLGNPTPAQQEAHRDTLKWLLRWTHALHVAVADPDFPNSRLADELEGRLVQLNESWRMFNNSMSAAEADALLAKVFPE